MQEVLFECGGDCGFAGRGEAGEPDCETFLLAEGEAFRAGEAGVPGYVAWWM